MVSGIGFKSNRKSKGALFRKEIRVKDLCVLIVKSKARVMHQSRRPFQINFAEELGREIFGNSSN